MLAIFTKLERYLGFSRPLVWRNVIGFIILHIAMIYTFLVIIPFEARFITILLGWLYGCGGGLATTIGAHRLWTHKTFKAKLPLRIFIMYWFLTAGQYSVIQWARDHRTHHKFTDTDADPHNARRGFFYSQCGWLLMKRHPEHKEKGKLIDVSDIWEDPVVRFTQKYFVPLMLLCHSVIPACFAHYILGETWLTSIVGVVMARYIVALHAVWLVNSVAHLWGYKPYNKNIMAVQNKLAAFFTLGEAWHNFHHTFPWDYRIGEFGQGYQLGTYFIDLFSWLGLAYDLKTASPEMIEKVLAKQGELEVNEEVPYPEINDDKVKQEDSKKNIKVN